jgi:hypothetical protein
MINQRMLSGSPRGSLTSREPEPVEPSQEYVEITRQIADLREALGQAVEEFDARLTQLEKIVPADRSSRPGRRSGR